MPQLTIYNRSDDESISAELVDQDGHITRVVFEKKTLRVIEYFTSIPGNHPFKIDNKTKRISWNFKKQLGCTIIKTLEKNKMTIMDEHRVIHTEELSDEDVADLWLDVDSKIVIPSLLRDILLVWNR